MMSGIIGFDFTAGAALGGAATGAAGGRAGVAIMRVNSPGPPFTVGEAGTAGAAGAVGMELCICPYGVLGVRGTSAGAGAPEKMRVNSPGAEGGAAAACGVDEGGVKG